MINWIAKVTMDDGEGWKQRGWFRQVETAEFAHRSTAGCGTGYDVPDLIRHADGAFETPMIDRDPIPTWQDGPVVLMGDAAHPMYPTGSNRGSQAIVDARVLELHDRARRDAAAFEAFDKKFCRDSAGRCATAAPGPFRLLNMVDERCAARRDIDDVMPAKERAEFMAGYRPLRALR